MFVRTVMHVAESFTYYEYILFHLFFYNRYKSKLNIRSVTFCTISIGYWKPHVPLVDSRRYHVLRILHFSKEIQLMIFDWCWRIPRRGTSYCQYIHRALHSWHSLSDLSDVYLCSKWRHVHIIPALTQTCYRADRKGATNSKLNLECDF